MRNLKRVLSLALALVMVIGMMAMSVSAATYTDDAEIEYKEAVAVMTGIKLYEGNPDGSLAPKQVLNRAMAATILTRIMLGDKADNLIATKQIFSDVKVTDWYAEEVEYCYNVGLIAGNGDGTFAPEAELTGIAFAKLLLVALGYDADEQGYVGPDWSTNIAVDALANDLYIKGVDIADKLTREQAAQMILQAMDEQVVYYENSFDKATGAPTLVGPYKMTKTEGVGFWAKQVPYLFMHKYYPTLTKVEDGYTQWGRPVDFQWKFGGKAIYTVMKQPLKVYTEFVTECDIADDLDLAGRYTDVTKVTMNNVAGNETYVDALETVWGFGDQGVLFEIYDDGNDGLEFVFIETFLAQVTDVTEVTYDRNKHLDEMAELYMWVYEDETAKVVSDDWNYVLESAKDWDYAAGEWLLVYVDEAGYEANGYEPYPVIVGAPETLKGAQTAYTTVETHEVEDVEYPDAYNFNLDQAGNQTTDHIWFFDQYGNLIGVIDPAKAADTYGVISQIYWRDSRDGDAGYAWTQITYMDGTSKWMAVSMIDGKELYGVEGKYASYSNQAVSSTKQYNEYGVSDDSDFTDLALYKIVNTADGIDLQPVAPIEGQLITNQKTLLKNVAYANSKTMFLVYNEKYDEYTTYVGVRNLPSYKDTLVEMWAADITNDTNAEYVFVIDPETATSNPKDVVALYHAERVTVKTNLKSGKIVSYTITGGKVNGEPASITVNGTKNDAGQYTDTSYEDNALVKEILSHIAKCDGVMVLTSNSGAVIKVDCVYEADGSLTLVKDKKFVEYVGTLGIDCIYEPDDETLLIDATHIWVDVMDAKLVGASSWKAAERSGETEVIIVYDADNVVSEVYFVDIVTGGI